MSSRLDQNAVMRFALLHLLRKPSESSSSTSAQLGGAKIRGEYIYHQLCMMMELSDKSQVWVIGIFFKQASWLFLRCVFLLCSSLHPGPHIRVVKWKVLDFIPVSSWVSPLLFSKFSGNFSPLEGAFQFLRCFLPHSRYLLNISNEMS